MERHWKMRLIGDNTGCGKAQTQLTYSRFLHTVPSIPMSTFTFFKEGAKTFKMIAESSCRRTLWFALFSSLTFVTADETPEPRRQTIFTFRQCHYNPAGPLRPGILDTTCPLPVDDTTNQHGSWAPWSYPPVCISASAPTHPKLCVYTLTDFRGAGSISILTTPEAAASSIANLDDSDIKWIDQAKGGNVSRPAHPSPCLVMNIPGKGRGVVARRAIAEGEVLMAELPVMLRPLAFGEWPAEGQDLAQLLASAGNQMAEEERRLVMNMARSTGGNILDDIFNTNSFGVSFGGVEHSGLFPDTAVSFLFKEAGIVSFTLLTYPQCTAAAKPCLHTQVSSLAVEKRS